MPAYASALESATDRAVSSGIWERGDGMGVPSRSFRESEKSGFDPVSSMRGLNSAEMGFKPSWESGLWSGLTGGLWLRLERGLGGGLEGTLKGAPSEKVDPAPCISWRGHGKVYLPTDRPRGRSPHMKD